MSKKTKKAQKPKSAKAQNSSQPAVHTPHKEFKNISARPTFREMANSTAHTPDLSRMVSRLSVKWVSRPGQKQIPIEFIRC